MNLPANYEELKALFEKNETGSGKQLDIFLKEAAYKYEVGLNKLVFKAGQSYYEFLDWNLIKGLFKAKIITSITKHVNKYFTNPKLKQLLEFPILFLGALPSDTPALYSLMNYADMKLGTWYPEGGMYKIVEGMYNLAKELGVNFLFDQTVNKINFKNNIATSITFINSKKDKPEVQEYHSNVIIGSADYHFIET